MKIKPIRFRLLTAVLLVTLTAIQGASAQGDSTTTVINAINQRRVGQDLTALISDRNLMEIAQSHSQYQASLGSAAELGPDGSLPTERAEAAGFGAGAEIQIHENEACQINAGIEEILEEIWTGTEQQAALFDPDARYIGAGVAYAGELVCYTVITGYWIGEPDPTIEISATSGTPAATTVSTPVPIVVSTPLGDGSVRHIVANGQTLWIISSVYNIPLEELREINGFDAERVVNPGEEVLIRPSYTPTNTPIGQASPTPLPRFTHTPSPIGYQETPAVFAPTTSTPTQAGVSEARFRASTKNPTVVLAAVLISGGTLAAALVLSLRNRNQGD